MKRSIFLFTLIVGAAACKKNSYNPPPAAAENFQQVNLVADADGFGAARIDPGLLNAWGIAVNPGGIIWIGANHAGASAVYDTMGRALLDPIAIPSQGVHFGGSPTGVIFNNTADFVIPSTQAAAKFIFANEDGTLSAWSGGDSTHTVADRSSSGAVYKGIALANDENQNFLYAANFSGRTIDVFDNTFHLTAGRPLSDPDIPGGFGPFNIVNIGGKLFVTYARLKGPDNEDDQAGPGNGYVDIFLPDGVLLKRFATQGPLNSPWGIAQVPLGSSTLPGHSILIGNFGDGWINMYDSTGVYKGALQSNGHPIAITGLWALDFVHNEDPHADPNKLYFTAGPLEENHGLFGYLLKQ